MLGGTLWWVVYFDGWYTMRGGTIWYNNEWYIFHINVSVLCYFKKLLTQRW